jgi:hypothetical protein
MGYVIPAGVPTHTYPDGTKFCFAAIEDDNPVVTDFRVAFFHDKNDGQGWLLGETIFAWAGDGTLIANVNVAPGIQNLEAWLISHANTIAATFPSDTTVTPTPQPTPQPTTDTQAKAMLQAWIASLKITPNPAGGFTLS